MHILRISGNTKQTVSSANSLCYQQLLLPFSVIINKTKKMRNFQDAFRRASSKRLKTCRTALIPKFYIIMSSCCVYMKVRLALHARHQVTGRMSKLGFMALRVLRKASEVLGSGSPQNWGKSCSRTAKPLHSPHCHLSKAIPFQLACQGHALLSMAFVKDWGHVPSLLLSPTGVDWDVLGSRHITTWVTPHLINCRLTRGCRNGGP